MASPMRYLTIDGMMSGTGIRDSVEGGYVKPGELNLSDQLQERLAHWLRRYEEAHYRQCDDAGEVAALDAEGLAIARLVRGELPGSKVEYFSDATMTKLNL